MRDPDGAGRVGVIQGGHHVREGVAIGDENAAYCLEPVEAVGAAVQSESDGHAQFPGDIDGVLVVAPVGPDHDPWPLAGMPGDYPAAGEQVVVYALAPGGRVFIGGAVRIVAAGCHGGLQVALWVALDAVVQVITVRGDLHQAGLGHLAQLRPGHEL